APAGGAPGRVCAGIVGVVEDERHVDLAGPQLPQRLGRLRLDEGQLDAGMVGGERGRRYRYHGGQRRRERRQPHPPGPQPAVRGQLRLGDVQPPEYLLGPLGEHPPGLGQPDAAPDPLDQPRAGLALQPGQVVADRRLGVAQLVGGGGDRAVPGHGGEHPQSGHVQHRANISVPFIGLFRNWHWTYESSRAEHGGMDDALTMVDVLRARATLSRYLPPTPMWSYPALDAVAGTSVLVKHENVQPTGAFEVRGGLALLAGMPPADLARGVVTWSTGNHAQSIAYASRVFGNRCVVVMPAAANEVKV